MNLFIRWLRWLALFIGIGGTAFWLVTGANRGWSKTSVAKKTLDEVTGIEGITYESRFVPGLDFLGVAWMAAVGLGGVSLVLRKISVRNPRNKN